MRTVYSDSNRGGMVLLESAPVLGISDRHMRRWRERYEEFGYDGLMDRRRGRPSTRRVPLAVVEQES